MNNFEICKAMITLENYVTYQNRYGTQEWTILDRFVHFNGIGSLAVSGVKIEKPKGFGTYASNPYYPAFHHTDEIFSAWKKALNWYQEQGSIDCAVEFLNYHEFTYTEGCLYKEFLQGVILTLCGVSWYDVAQQHFSVHCAWNAITFSKFGVGKTILIKEDKKHLLEVYDEEDEYIFEIKNDNMTDLFKELSQIIELSELLPE